MTTTLIQIKDHRDEYDQVIFECQVPNDVENKIFVSLEKTEMC